MVASPYGNEPSASSAKQRSDSWDQYFMTMAYLVAMKSKDPSTKVGAIIIGADKEIRATGYNGLPRGVQDLVERYTDRNYKYLASNHAEENAILHCARVGLSAKNCIVYVPWIPCSACAKAIIQVGICEVVYHEEFPGNWEDNQYNWQERIAISKELLVEAGVIVRGFSSELLKIKGLYREREFELRWTE